MATFNPKTKQIEGAQEDIKEAQLDRRWTENIMNWVIWGDPKKDSGLNLNSNEEAF